MTKTTLTSSRFTDILGEPFAEGFFDELEKIAEKKQDTPFKRAVKNIALASLGAAAGTGTAMLGGELFKRTLGPRYEKLLPSTKLKILAPALAVTTTALLGAGIALQREMSKQPPKKEPSDV